jgi:hypothetical protein
LPSAETLERLRILPYFCSTKCFWAALVIRKAPLRCTFMTRSQSSSVILNSRLSRVIPALLTRMWMPPSSATTRAIAASTDAALLTSQPMPIAVPPSRPAASLAAASSRSMIATAAPSSENRLAVPNPMPRAAPVMTATRPSKRPMVMTPP